MMPFVEPAAANLWHFRSDFSFHGIVRLGRWMVAVRLADGGLWVCSPGNLHHEAVRRDLEALGPPRCFVCAGNMHSLHIEQALEYYPEASVYAPRSVVRRKPELSFTGTLEETESPPWAGQIDGHKFAGTKPFHDWLFCHRESRTLIIPDLLSRFDRRDAWLTRVLARAVGIYDRVGFPRPAGYWIADREAARASADTVLAWDFDRVELGHGWGLESGGKQAIRDAFRRARLI